MPARNSLLVWVVFGVLCLMFCGCGHADYASKEQPTDPCPGCTAAEQQLIGSWAIAETCDWAWGNGCKTIPDSEQEPSLVFLSNGTCRWVINDTMTYESPFRVVFGENVVSRKNEYMLKIGTVANNTTYAFNFDGHNIVWMGAVGHDAGVSKYVRFP